MRLNNEYFILFLAILLNFALLIFSTSKLSIGYNEALIFFGESSFLKEAGFLHEIVKNSYNILADFVGKDFAIRMPFLLAHLINIFLIYKVSKNILKKRYQRLIAACIYMYLPGVLASAIIINQAVFIILISLIILLLTQNKHYKSLFILLLASIFVSQAFICLYLALFFYGLYKKSAVYSVFGAVFCLAWIIIFDFDISGKPKGYLIDTMAVFGAAFSPFIFIYFIYSFYRIWLKESKDFLWFIATCSFIFALLFSLRARPALEMFLPFCVIFVPHMTRLFFASYSVRLPAFRLKYKLLGALLAFSLAIIASASIFSDFLYAFLNEPKRHFAYPYAVAKELASELKKRGINEIQGDYSTMKRLEFYDVKYGGFLFLSQNPCGERIEIKKFNKAIATFYICK